MLSLIALLSTLFLNEVNEGKTEVGEIKIIQGIERNKTKNVLKIIFCKTNYLYLCFLRYHP